ncbi:F420-dependent oxidoreductase [Streptomyces sp. AcH 505]|uniref:LLM class F420-dependent oxidoreductase n=1 Tax=Streptomyces sp. AcH 505 TaxID=352211 RepID=UPI000591AAD8|nr:F420-dependent oxidoreductase [Streptomyces sp. AcH 505]
MDLSMTLDYTQDVVARLPGIRDLEAAGLDALWVQEGYSFDAVSAIGFLAAHTTRVRLGTAILNVYSRSPALLAMTAAGCDQLSGGRFCLGLGASGPQVVEGFHGVPYERPLARIRETIDVCRTVWRREPLSYQGRSVVVPLPAGSGTGQGVPLKLVNRPRRADIPVYWAALGDLSVAAAAETADGWLPFFFVPERAGQAFGAPLARGTALRDPALGPLDVVASVDVAVGDGLDTEELLRPARERIALYAGGMGSRTSNFYHTLACRMGWEKEAGLMQDLFLAGKRAEAAAAVPADWLALGNLVGPEGHVAERLAAFAAAGVTTLDIRVVGGADPVRTVDTLRRLM